MYCLIEILMPCISALSFMNIKILEYQCFKVVLISVSHLCCRVVKIADFKTLHLSLMDIYMFEPQKLAVL